MVAAGPFEEIVTRGDISFAKRDDSGAVLTSGVEVHDPPRQLTGLRAGSVLLWVPLLDSALGSRLRVRIPAREVILAPVEPGLTSVHNVIAGRVGAITQDAVEHIALVEITLPDRGALLARVTPDAVERLALAVGKDVVALVKSTSIKVLPG